mgnify:CR=1 FL=1
MLVDKLVVAGYPIHISYKTFLASELEEMPKTDPGSQVECQSPLQ